MTEPLVEVCALQNFLGGRWVHKEVNFRVDAGEIVAIIGGSGTGKTTILRSLLMLQRPTGGNLKLFGKDIWQLKDHELVSVRQKLGMLFQKSALFSGLNILENVMFPLQQFTTLPLTFIEELARLKLLLVGIEKQDMHKMPSELSGGMQKRVAAARAIALEPPLLLLDEPVAGLDPKGVQSFDELLLFLRKQLNITILMVSHDLASLARVTDRVIFLGEGKVLSEGPLAEVKKVPHPAIQQYFEGMS